MASLKRKLTDFSPSKFSNGSRCWVSTAGKATLFFVSLHGERHKDLKDSMINALAGVSLMGYPKATKKNENVIQVLVASNQHTKMFFDAALSIIPELTITNEYLNHFKEQPTFTYDTDVASVTVKAVVGSLYMLTGILTDETRFGARQVVENKEFIIDADDEITPEDIVQAVSGLAKHWGFIARSARASTQPPVQASASRPRRSLN